MVDHHLVSPRFFMGHYEMVQDYRKIPDRAIHPALETGLEFKLLAAHPVLWSRCENAHRTLPPIHLLRENIEHELHAFHSRMSCQNYASELITIPHYLLSATIDELLGKNYLRL